jgi:hypothetical protein
MSVILLVATLICLALGLGFFLLIKALWSGRDVPPATLEWVGELSVSKYRPMERLLEDRDYEFLAAQPGFNRKMVRRLRSERRRVFRGYLRCLSRDFNRVCGGIQMIMLQSDQDRPDLATILVRQKLLFALGMTAVQFRLILHACGIGAVDARHLVQALEAMRVEMRDMQPVRSAAGA